jgi:hypothetical protein
MKIRPVGAELFHAEGRTDMTKLTVAFRNFANVSEKEERTDLHTRGLTAAPSMLYQHV